VEYWIQGWMRRICWNTTYDTRVRDFSPVVFMINKYELGNPGEFEDLWQPASNINPIFDISRLNRRNPKAGRCNKGEINKERFLHVDDNDHLIYIQDFIDSRNYLKIRKPLTSVLAIPWLSAL
jgi:hypothetical protein